MLILSPGYRGKGGQTGCLEIFDPARARAYDTFTCHHCSRVVFVRAGADPSELGGHCKTCDKLICPTCNAKGKCTPWEKQLEHMEARARLYEAVQAV